MDQPTPNGIMNMFKVRLFEGILCFESHFQTEERWLNPKPQGIPVDSSVFSATLAPVSH